MIVLDTNVISEIFRPAPDARVVAWLESLSGDVAITAIALAELLAGVRRFPDGRRKTALAERIDIVVDAYRDDHSVLAFDALAADQYATDRPRRAREAGIADPHGRCTSRRDLSCAQRHMRDSECQKPRIYRRYPGRPLASPISP